MAKEDRWAIQEFLFLCECEEFLEKVVPQLPKIAFTFQPTGNYFKGHGEQCAHALRERLGYGPEDIGTNVFTDLRRLGIHVFRRRWANSQISGLFVMHPVAGRCVLVNYEEDVYRQRLTAAHEGGHALLDADEQVVVSFITAKGHDLREARAFSFASHLLMPREFLQSIPQAARWDRDKAIHWANAAKVSTSAFAIALKEAGLIDAQAELALKGYRVPQSAKEDPELPKSLSPRGTKRKSELLSHGLSDYYVGLAFEAYDQGQITAGRLAEMLLLHAAHELPEFAELYGRNLQYGG